MSTDLPRRYKARYASSMAGEIEKNVVLAPGEEILYSGLAKERINWLVAEPRMFAITPLRMILLEHNFFTADWILEIPRSAITRVSDEDMMSGWVNFNYSNAGATRTVRIQPMQRYVSEKESRELFVLIDAFHRGQLNSAVSTLV